MPKDTRLESTQTTQESAVIDAAGAGDDLLDTLRRLVPCKPRLLEEKEVLYREGDEAESVFVILRGMVKLLVHLPNGKVRIVRLHVAGDWLAIEGLGKDQAYEHTAIAVSSNTELVQFPSTRLSALLQEDGDLYAALLKRGFDHLEKADRWIAEFSTGSIKARLAHLLEFLGDLETGEKPNTISLLTVNETADVLGVTPESVSRFLAEFKRNKVLIQADDDDNWLYRIDKTRLDREKRD
jgi:CRP/FNR family transcriptional regulator, anaerobic regulatory protein